MAFYLRPKRSMAPAASMAGKSGSWSRIQVSIPRRHPGDAEDARARPHIRAHRAARLGDRCRIHAACSRCRSAVALFGDTGGFHLHALQQDQIRSRRALRRTGQDGSEICSRTARQEALRHSLSGRRDGAQRIARHGNAAQGARHDACGACELQARRCRFLLANRAAERCRCRRRHSRDDHPRDRRRDD